MSEQNPFEFDEQIHEVKLLATTKKGTTRPVYHRLRKPTLDELNKREAQIQHETTKKSSREVEVRTLADTADTRLWDKVILAVKGYQDSDDWRELSQEEKAEFNAAHKTDAIGMLYACKSQIDGDGDYVPIGPSEWTVRQEIGASEEPDFLIYHTLREPTEDQRLRFERAKSSTSHVTGARQEQAVVRTYLKAYIDLYNALIQQIKGGTVGGAELSAANRKEFLEIIDPLWKRDVIFTFMSALEAQISD